MAFFTCFCLSLSLWAQQTKEVLFLGNSYTNANNLPMMVHDIALSKGDTLIYDSNTPGGYTLNGHSANVISQDLITKGSWDYVVMQEQSQLPSLPDSIFHINSLNVAITLAGQIRAVNPVTIPMFYMTWGRKNGDASNCGWWPQVCTYAGMQSILRSNYLIMGDTNMAEVAPVGAVWRDVRANNSSIELYAGDGSHPSLAGTYLAACTFYASIFHKSPVGAYFPQNLNAADAQIIQDQAYQTVFDSLSVWMINTGIGIEELNSIELAVFPNPAKTKLRVELSGSNYRPFDFKIYSMEGSLVKSGASYEDVNIENLSSGTYIIKTQIDDTIMSTQFVKQ